MTSSCGLMHTANQVLSHDHVVDWSSYVEPCSTPNHFEHFGAWVVERQNPHASYLWLMKVGILFACSSPVGVLQKILHLLII